MDSSAAFWRVLGTLGDSPRKSGSGYEARCPAHEDRHASLSVGIGLDGRVLLNCHAGCPVDKVLGALGLSLSDLFERSAAGNPVRRFRLLDPSGTTVATHVREDLPGDKKLWWESHGKAGLNGTPLADLPFYRLPDVLVADMARPVIVCEGEKATDALADLGLLAVGTVTGASGTPGPEIIATLRGRPVWLWPDNDRVGREHMQRIAVVLYELGTSPRWIEWKDAPDHGDAADYVVQGGTADGVQTMLRQLDLPKEHADGIVILRSYVDITPEDVHWLWQGRIALGKLTVLMGDPGLGKSLLTVHAASVVSTGGTWPDGQHCEQGSVIILTAEDGPADTVRPRLDVAGADVRRVFELQSIKNKPDDELGHTFQLATDIAALEVAIQQTGAKLVILDPLNAYLGGVDSHKAAEVRGVLAPLAAMADRTGVAVLVVHHLNKGTSTNALYRAGGSLDFVAAARSVLGVVPDPEQPERKLFVSVKVNIAMRPPGIGYRIVASDPMRVNAAPIVAWDNESVNVDPLTAFAGSTSPEERDIRTDIRDVLRECLSTGEAPADIIKAALKAEFGTFNEQTLRKVRKSMGIRVERKGFGSGGQWVWVRSIEDTKKTTLPVSISLSPMSPMSPMESIEHIEDIGDIGDIGNIGDTHTIRARAREGLLCRTCGVELISWQIPHGYCYACTPTPYKEDW